MAQKTNIIKKKPQTKQKNHKKIWLVVAIICVIVLAVASGVAIFLNREVIFKAEQEPSQNINAEQSEQKTPSSNDTTDEAEERHDSTSSTRDGSNREEGKESIAQYNGEDPNNLQEITGSINYIGVSEGEFIVSATIDQELGDSGICKFTITRSSGATIVQETSTSAGPSTSFCEYSIPAANISSGHYNVAIEISADGKKGTINGGADI